MRLTLGFVAETLLGRGSALAGSSLEVVEAVVDSRQCRAGCLFVALKGEQTDGHAYVAAALERGALAAIVRSGWAEGGDAAGVPPERLLPVADPLVALQQLAAAWRCTQPATVVGITGSIGKTLTKDVVAAVLGARYRVHKSAGNRNNEIGLPLTLLGLRAEHRYAVVEMGMYALGEIAALTEIARPTIGVVANVGPTHMERLGSIERIAAAKAELVQALPAEGLAVLNGDDERVRAMAGLARCPVLTYGFGAGNDLAVVAASHDGLEGSTITVVEAEERQELVVPLPGRHSVYAALAAVAVARAAGLTWDEVRTGLAASGDCGRMKCLHSGNLLILDDCYNSAPASATAALALLADLPRRRVAVLADMLELGPAAEAGHREVGQKAGAAADVVIAVGPQARWIAEEASRGSAAVTWCDDRDHALAALKALLQPGDAVLVKGSRGMRMEAVVEALLAPGNAGEKGG
ncbi:MAG: UDP-N-acetylmuramoyl-tripeptide--D-alanyl-D-alanine ligase [Anaerolineae bacterium]